MYHEIKPESNVIERFHVSSEDGYSEFWRRDKSPIEILELAKLLVALRKISSYIGRNVGSIVWSGMNYTNGIALDPTPVIGKYPVPASKTDIMVGFVIQRSYEKTEWSERFKKIALSQLKLSPPYTYKFNLYFDMCEKVYFDCLSNRSVQAYYTEKARKREIHKKSKEFIQPPTVSELLYIWWWMAADRSKKRYKEEFQDRSAGGLTERTNLEKFYKEPIALLNSIAERLISESPQIVGVTERGNFRIKLYLSIWDRLLEHIKFWPTDRADPYLLFDKFTEEIEKEEKEKKAVKATIISYADQIERTLTTKNPDFTDQVKSNVMNVDEVVRIEGNDIVMRAINKIDKKLFHNLQIVFKAVAQRRTDFNRGLKTGKIDRRRLYRAPTTGTVFQLKKDNFELINDIVLLVDATGSMADPTKWDQAETIFQTLFSVVKTYNRTARIFAYNEVRNICKLTELYMGGIFFTIFPHGKTASGEAIIATALNLKGKHKKPFIIHITDGASNWGCGVSDAMEFCKKNRINLLTLGMGCGPASKQSLRKEYGKLVQFVDNTDDLPHLFRSLLNYSKGE